MHKILAIGRAPRFSPNSVGKDAAILECVCSELMQRGYDVETVSETDTDLLGAYLGTDAADVPVACVSMGRSGHTLDVLRGIEAGGRVVLNSTAAVALCCNRRRLTEVLRRAGVPVPPERGRHGYWLKRADAVAEGPGDVRFAADEARMRAVEADMYRCGVADVMVSAHVPGDLVKFYGVRGSQFFRIFYPGDDGQWKFGDERLNGVPKHYPFSVTGLHAMAEKAAAAVGAVVYGGDCIVTADGGVSIIDFNDWPSFSRCRDEAAAAIAAAVCGSIELATSRNCEKKIIYA